MKTMQRFIARGWRPALLVFTLSLIAYVLYFHHIGSLLPGYAPVEAATYHRTVAVTDLLHNPLNAPYKIVLLLTNAFGHAQLLNTRIAAAICSLAAVVVFFFITRSWYGFRVSFLGTVLFATSSGFLHFARLGTPQILQMGILMLIGVLLWHRRKPALHPYLTYLVIVVFGALLYVPGMIWFEIILVGLIWKRIARHWQRGTNTNRATWTVLTVLLIAPIVYTALTKSELLLPALGIPTDLGSLKDFPLNLVHTVFGVGLRSSGTALIWVGHSPLLNAIELILGFLGVYYYIYQERSLRSILLAASGIASVVLVSLAGGVSMACIVPIVYLLVTGGLNHFLGEWLAVFPRNPIARSVGIGVICIMLFFSALYHVRSYFVAWPHNSATQQIFTIEQL